MKKLLIIFTSSMDLGGIEKSLLGLLDTIDYNKIDVDLFLFGHHGPLFSSINQNVNLLPEVRELACLDESLIKKIHYGAWHSALLRIRDEIRKHYTSVDYNKTWEYLVERYVPVLTTKYDLAISFFRPFNMIEQKVTAVRKAGWIHTDYKHAGENLISIEADYSRLDTIVAVSEECAKGFSSLFPSLKKRLITIENILPANCVREEAKKPIVSNEMREKTKYRLLTVGRFSFAKNMDNIPDICRKIREAGLDVIWYLIGYGAEEEKIRQKIKESKMQDCVVILGEKENPYPYMARCDLYIQPSRYEGKSVCVREAQILCKPVVITNYETSGSQLQDGVDGIIVPMDNEGCANGIISLLQNPKKMKELENNCSQRDYSNADEINKIYRMME